MQGGTFRNPAVLRALEEYLDKEVKLAPYPGEMGAIGAALATQKYMKEGGVTQSKFIGFPAVQQFSYETKTSVKCNGCGNECNRTIIEFSTGDKMDHRKSLRKGLELGEKRKTNKKGINLFAEREAALFQDYPYKQVAEDKGETIGIPRVLEFWDSMPFWSTFLRH